MRGLFDPANMLAGVMETRICLSRPVSLKLTLGALCHGRGDPCVRFDGHGFWRATRTPEGPATVLLQEEGDTVAARAWGDGSAYAIDGVRDLIGENQNDALFDPAHPVVRDLHRRLVGLRVPRTRSVFEALIPAILEQRVTGMEAKHSYSRLIRTLGEPAPGPCPQGLTVPPTPKRLAAKPSWWFHRFGVERKRAEALITAARCAHRLEEAVNLTPCDATKRLTAIPGVGPWTAAEVAYVALGDADAVSVGDYHLHDWVSWALAGEPRGSDERMLELLGPFKGQRGRVVRLIACGHPLPPKYGARYNPIPIAAL